MDYKDTLKTRGFMLFDRCSVCPVGTIKETWGSQSMKGIIFKVYPNTKSYIIEYRSIQKHSGTLANIENEINEQIVKIKTE